MTATVLILLVALCLRITALKSRCALLPRGDATDEWISGEHNRAEKEWLNLLRQVNPTCQDDEQTRQKLFALLDKALKRLQEAQRVSQEIAEKLSGKGEEERGAQTSERTGRNGTPQNPSRDPAHSALPRRAARPNWSAWVMGRLLG